MIREFSFERVNKSGAVFDQEKLNWMNQQYIQKLELNDLQQRLKPFINKTPYAGKKSENSQEDYENPPAPSGNPFGNSRSSFVIL
ncbi:MAG: hypothetical protein Ct9H300mP28_26900 [Pseudomonadota bacterium]|nr:MAG: hypothetical protein Ct9H300mP28_26900 [Pseudomonadota bacterium]